MAEKKEDFGGVAYIFGIISIVLAFFQPIAAIVFGIIGALQSKKQKTALSEKAKKFSTIGIVLGIIMLVISIIAGIYLTKIGLMQIPSFPA